MPNHRHRALEALVREPVCCFRAQALRLSTSVRGTAPPPPLPMGRHLIKESSDHPQSLGLILWALREDVLALRVGGSAQRAVQLAWNTSVVPRRPLGKGRIGIHSNQPSEVAQAILGPQPHHTRLRVEALYWLGDVLNTHAVNVLSNHREPVALLSQGSVRAGSMEFPYVFSHIRSHCTSFMHEDPLGLSSRDHYVSGAGHVRACFGVQISTVVPPAIRVVAFGVGFYPPYRDSASRSAAGLNCCGDGSPNPSVWEASPLARGHVR